MVPGLKSLALQLGIEVVRSLRVLTHISWEPIPCRYNLQSSRFSLLVSSR